MRKFGKVDLNQGEIESALHDAFMTTVSLAPIGSGVPDLLVGGVMPCGHCGKKVHQNKLLEVKSDKGKLTSEQERFHQWWLGQIVVVRSIDEALKVCGITVER